MMFIKRKTIREWHRYFHNCSMLKPKHLHNLIISKGNLQLESKEDFYLASEVCAFLLSNPDIKILAKINKEVGDLIDKGEVY